MLDIWIMFGVVSYDCSLLENKHVVMTYTHYDEYHDSTLTVSYDAIIAKENTHVAPPISA